jgi:hypothetical protein
MFNIQGTSITLTGNVAMDINGATTAGTDYDQIYNSTASGVLNVAGVNLTVTKGNGYTPTAGTSFDLFKATGTGGTRTGTFASTSFPAANWSADYGTSTTAKAFYKGDQTISFGALSAQTYGATSTLSATGGASGNPMVFTSSNTAVATCTGTNGTTLTGVGVGSCTIYANQAGNANYMIASQVSQSLTVNAKSLTISSAAATNKVYDGNNTAIVSGSLSGVINSDDVSLSGTGTFASIAVADGIAVTSTSTLGGTKAGNYTLIQPTGLTANITPATLLLNTGTTENASNYTIAQLENSNLIVSSGEFIADRATNSVQSVTVAPGAKLSLGSNALSITGDVLLKANTTNSFSANIGDGTLTVTGAIKYLRTIDQSKWYFISFPSDVQITTITGNPALGELGIDWFIKYYDGAKRGTSGTGANWISITANDVTADPTLKLNKNQGYIVGLKNGKPDTELSFTLDKTVLSTESTRSITVAANTGAAGVTNHGWNLIGQPYLSNYVGSNATGVFNIYISDGTSTYTPYTKATVPMMLPMSAYFIQASTTLAGTGISFNTAGRQSVPSLVAIDSSDEVQLSLTSDTGTDYTLLTMDNNLSTDYEIGYDLEKWIGTGTDKPQVYSQLNGINYAFNALPMNSVNNLPIGIYTKNAGNTTISVNATQAPSLSKLLLTDNATSPATVTDLLTSVYSFTATAGTDNTRFVLTAQRVPTASVIETKANGTTFTIVNSMLLINNLNGKASVRVFDAIGRTIANKTLNNSLLEIQLPAIGMYSVQIEANGKIWTRKIINQK